MWESELELVRHINEEIQFCIHYTQSETEDSFQNNEVLKRAVIRSIEIIGEASKKLHADFRNGHPHIPWKKMAGMRDVLIYDYTDVAMNWFGRLQRYIYHNWPGIFKHF